MIFGIFSNRLKSGTASSTTATVAVGSYNNTTKVIAGKAPANSVVTIRIDNTVVGTTTTDSAGNWNYALVVPASMGAVVTTTAVVVGSSFTIINGISGLQALTASQIGVTIGLVADVTILGRTSGSTLTLSGAGATGLVIDNDTAKISGTPTSVGVVNIIETLAGVVGSPKITSNIFTVVSATAGLITLSARAINAEDPAGTTVATVSNLRASAIASIVTGSPFVALQDLTLVKGSRSYRPGFHSVVLRDTAPSGSPIDTTLTLKAPRSSTLVENFESIIGNWSGQTGSGAIHEANKNWFLNGKQSYRMAQPDGASATVEALKTFASPLTVPTDGVFEIAANVENLAKTTSFVVEFTNASNVTTSFTFASLRLGPAKYGRAFKSGSAGASFIGPVTTMKLKVLSASAGTGGISFDSVRFGVKKKAIIIPVASGAFVSQNRAQAMLSAKNKGWRLALGLQRSLLGTTDAAVPRHTLASLKAAVGNGVIVCSQSDAAADLTALTKAAAKADLQAVSDYIRANNLDTTQTTLGRNTKSSAYHLFYPVGDYNDTVIAAAREANMTTGWSNKATAMPHRDGIIGNMTLNRTPMAGKTWAQIRDEIDAAIIDGNMLAVSCRDLDGSSNGTTDTIYQSFVDYLDAQDTAGNLEVMNLVDFWESLPVAPLRLSGFNLAGGEFGGAGLDDYSQYSTSFVRDATSGQMISGPSSGPYINYVMPDLNDVSYLGNRGANVIRFPFRYHHLYFVNPAMDPTLDVERSTEWTKVNAFLDACDARSITVLFDMHEYGYKTMDGDPGRPSAYHTTEKFYQNNSADIALFAGRWKRIATNLKYRPNIRYGLMNEPTSYSAAPKPADLGAIYQGVINVVAAEDTNPEHLFHINGWGYSSAIEWITSGNGAMVAALVDPRGGKLVGEPHQYLDIDPRFPGSNSHPGKEENSFIVGFADQSGTFTFGGQTYSFNPALKDATEHARANGYKLFLGEMATTQDAVYVNEGRRELRYIHDNRDVWDGFSYWGAGAWWPKSLDAASSASKVFSPLPMDRTSLEQRPVMNMISEFLDVGPLPTATVTAIAAPAPPIPNIPTANFLTVLGATAADWNAISNKGLKEIAPAGMLIGRSVDNLRIDNGRGDGNYIASTILARDYNAWVGENTDKPTNELKEGQTDWSRDNVVWAELAQKAPDMLQNKAFHLGAGWDSYAPTQWDAPKLVDKLASDPAYMKVYLDSRLAQIAARWAALGPAEAAKVHRVDVVNELSSQTAASVALDDSGWRLTLNSLRTASKTAAGLEAYGAGNTDSEKWIQRLFQQFAVIFPNADLCWTDFNGEQVQVADDLSSARYSYSSSGPTSLYVVASNNSGAIAKSRLERIKYEIFRYKKLGVPVSGVGYQFHTSSYYAGSDYDFRASLWDWNRWGIRPSVTELNSDLNPPGHLGSSPSTDVVNRYNAVHCIHQLDIMLEETNCREVTVWTPVGGSGGGAQSPSHQNRDFPIRTALALSLKKAKAVNQRTLKRSSNLTFRTRIPVAVEVTGTQSLSGNRVAQTAAGYVRRAWDWYNDTWHAMPIDPTTMILRAQFHINSSSFPAAGATIIGEFSTDGQTGISLVGKNNSLYVRQRIGGTNTDIQVPGVTLSTTNTLRQCVYMAFSADRTKVLVGYGTLSVTIDASTGAITVTPSQVAEQTISLPQSQPVKSNGHVYCVSDAQATAYHSALQVNIMGVYHGPDFGTDAARKALSIPERQEAWAPKIGDTIYAGD